MGITKLKNVIHTLVLATILLLTIFTVIPVVSSSSPEVPGPIIDDYYAVYMPDLYAQVAALRADEVQVATLPDIETVSTLEAEGYKVISATSSAFAYYDFNAVGDFPINSTHFRRAASYLTGRDELIATHPLFKGFTTPNVGWLGQLQGLYCNAPGSPALERWPYLSAYLAEDFSVPTPTDNAIEEMFLGEFVPHDAAHNPISKADAKANPTGIDHWSYEPAGTPIGPTGDIRSIEISADLTWGIYYDEMGDAWAAELSKIGIATTKDYADGLTIWLKLIANQPGSPTYDLLPWDTAWSKPDPFIASLYFHPDYVMGCCNWRYWIDAEATAWMDTYATTLNETLAVESAWKLQKKLAEEAICAAGFTWLEYTAFHSDLMGVMRSFMIADRGLGYLQLKWMTDEIRDAHNNAIKVAWSSQPDDFNPSQQVSVADSWMLGAITGGYGAGLGLTLQDPVTQEQKPWIAYHWTVETFPYGGATGTKITYWLRKDVYWHDGEKFDADDVKFSLEYGRDNCSHYDGQSLRATGDLINVTVTDVDADGWNEAVVYQSKTSAFYLSYIGFWGSMLPEHIWENVADPATAVPYTQDNPNPAAAAIGLTWVVGTGPWAFHKGDWVTDQYVHLRAARGANVLADFFRSAEVSIADINIDSIVNIFDLLLVGGHFLEEKSDPRYTIYADVTRDGIIDLFDLLVVSGKYLQTW